MPMPRKKLLVTGASGFLGWHLCRAASAAWDVYGTTFGKTVEIPTVKLMRTDLTDLDALQTLFQIVQPDAVIHAAALSQPNACEVNPDVSFAMNVQASQWIAEACATRDIPCVFTSTDQVFDGQRAPYREKDPVSPVNRYGEHKVMAEVEIRSRYPKTVICRLPLLFGVTPHAASFLQGFIAQLRRQEPLKLFTDEYRTPASATAIAQGILLALQQDISCLHLGGRERLSRYAFGQRLMERLNLSEDLLQPCLQADVSMAAPRPADVSLDSSLAFALGYNPLPIVEELNLLNL
jgi:dTDP-4-dehydrorhamnose reductase